MDSDILVQIIILAVLIMCSAYFSASETAFLSFNRIKLKSDADEGDKGAKRVLSVADNYDKMLSTILIGNNIVNIVATSLSTMLFVSIITGSEDLAVTVSTVVMTVTVLIFGEITPKTLAKKAPESFARFSAPILQVLSVLLTPLVAIFNAWQSFVTGFFGSKGENTVTEQELLTMVDEATEDGEIDKQEGELIKNAVKFYELDVTDILTPRVDMVAVNRKMNREQVAEVFSETEFSRLPVFENTLDNIVGILYQKDFNKESSGSDWQELIRPATFVFAGMKISRLLKLFQESKSHIVIVQDEYGGTEGVVTLEDVLEELVGEIYDEHDDAREEFRKVTDTIYIVGGAASVDDFFEMFELESEPVDSITTVGGFAAHQLGKIPAAGESFDFEHIKVIISRTDLNRVQEVKVIVGPKPIKID